MIDISNWDTHGYLKGWTRLYLAPHLLSQWLVVMHNLKGIALVLKNMKYSRIWRKKSS